MVATVEHRGDLRRIGESARKFIAWRKAHQLPPRVSTTFNILWDNPDHVADDEYCVDLGNGWAWPRTKWSTNTVIQRLIYAL